jgi:S-DNA-T family DNA segregation ATPase FtsK/SpoIIIE
MSRTRTANSPQNTIPGGLKLFLSKRLMELQGLLILSLLTAGAMMLATWSANDPSWSNAAGGTVNNMLGRPGAIAADKLINWLGLANAVAIAIPAFWATALCFHNKIGNWSTRSPSYVAAIVSGAVFLSLMPRPSNWPLGTGLGGSIGDAGATLLLVLPDMAGASWLSQVFGVSVSLGLATWSTCKALQITLDDIRRILVSLKAPASGIGLGAVSASSRLAQTVGSLKDKYQAASSDDVGDVETGSQETESRMAHKGLLDRLRSRQRQAVQSDEDAIPAFLARQAPLNRDRIEPVLSRNLADDANSEADAETLTRNAGTAESEPEQMASTSSRVQPAAAPPKPGKRLSRDLQPDLLGSSEAQFALPPLSLLKQSDTTTSRQNLSADALEQNARMLEGVLEDFGVRGEIINVRPGPVVTLYELEPAPGIKSSRVIGLADDIARSMSAISVRVAVVPGRNVIGIEMPNSSRETVYLRELLASQEFEKTKHRLCMALGKDIGGEPSFADLARMPHLLIAGTTGSGKSVGINTMILSLLFRLPPEKCKLIMIDPKMLELSVYEGIPHLLAPVVTDPHKAVIALKWAVREMEERYRKMSKLGVRNIDGYNTRAQQAQKKGEVFTRQIQTGFDPETGAPVYEEEQMDLSPMPYIVVIIDEMADLMMVAGKDIEGAVQRLAQMARAAGIHVIMATQRPSVDVITGTIKANFPTRISFQVTSKIDSRTILGEQGAEQLLGQGDMLFMAGGGRISRLHGPFVSDDEVEQIVAHLKTQGVPDYVEAVTEESALGDGGGDFDAAGPGGGSGDDLYDQAVGVVLRDKKVSTSYIQRRLSIGYNKAATLIERMEEEGLISAANHAGKREILVGGDGE